MGRFTSIMKPNRSWAISHKIFHIDVPEWIWCRISPTIFHKFKPNPSRPFRITLTNPSVSPSSWAPHLKWNSFASIYWLSERLVSFHFEWWIKFCEFSHQLWLTLSKKGAADPPTTTVGWLMEEWLSHHFQPKHILLPLSVLLAPILDSYMVY